jgi:anti-anti-sigma factor
MEDAQLKMAGAVGVRERIRRSRGVRLGLSGELDLQCLPELKRALRAALGARRRVWVDLSEVTFMDALCLRELTVQYQLHSDRLILWRPSPEVGLTLVICELEDWVSFHPHLTTDGERRRVPSPSD